jgi:hypothetical protein
MSKHPGEGIQRCPAGHAMTDDNLVPSRLPVRVCLQCHRRRTREYIRRRRAVEKTTPFQSKRSTQNVR